MTTHGDDPLLHAFDDVNVVETYAYEVSRRTQNGSREVLGYIVRRLDVSDDPWTAYATLTTVGRDWLGLHPTFGAAVNAIKQADAKLRAEEEDA